MNMEKIMRKEIFNMELVEKHRGQDGWIPACFAPEQFLNDGTNVKQMSILVSLKNNRVTVVQRMYWEDKKMWWYSRSLGGSISAWQPLPKPYKRRIV